MIRALPLAFAVGCSVSTLEPATDPPFSPEAEHQDWLAERALDAPGIGRVGVAVGDVNGDHRLDLLVTGDGGPPRLLLNRGALHFERVAAGVDAPTRPVSAALGDLDGDGDADAVLVGNGRAVVYHGRGDGTFDEAADLGDAGRAHGVLLGDIDGDGQTDLYLPGWHLPGTPTDAGENHLFLNRGDGSFDDAGAIDDGFSWVAAVLDADRDGALDLVVGNDCFVHDTDGSPRTPRAGLAPDRLYRGGDGLLAAHDSGVGGFRSTMGAAVGDLDGDGRLDLYLSDYGRNDALLARRHGVFEEGTDALGLGATWRDDPSCEPGDGACLLVSWGAAIEDLDLDGRAELVVLNGQLGERESDRQPVAAWKGTAEGYRPIDLGLGWLNARGLVPADLDGDGDLDLVVTTVDGGARLFENRTAPASWLRVRLRGTTTNPDGRGAEVRVTLPGGRRLVRPIGAGGVVFSSAPPEAHFGLGEATSVDVEVRWPNGRLQRLPNVATHQVLVATEPPRSE